MLRVHWPWETGIAVTFPDRKGKVWWLLRMACPGPSHCPVPAGVTSWGTCLGFGDTGMQSWLGLTLPQCHTQAWVQAEVREVSRRKGGGGGSQRWQGTDSATGATSPGLAFLKNRPSVSTAAGQCWAGSKCQGPAQGQARPLPPTLALPSLWGPKMRPAHSTSSFRSLQLYRGGSRLGAACMG